MSNHERGRRVHQWSVDGAISAHRSELKTLSVLFLLTYRAFVLVCVQAPVPPAAHCCWRDCCCPAVCPTICCACSSGSSRARQSCAHSARPGLRTTPQLHPHASSRSIEFWRTGQRDTDTREQLRSASGTVSLSSCFPHCMSIVCAYVHPSAA